MRKLASILSLAMVLLAPVVLAPSLAFAQEDRDRVAFGNDVYVGPHEVVHDAVSFGGNTVVEGHVTGSAASFGGSVRVVGDGRVDGDLTSFGGQVDGRSAAPSGDGELVPASDHGSRSEGPIDRFFAWIGETARNAAAHVMLFLLGLLMMAFSRERLRALQTTMIRDGLKTTGVGLLGYVLSVVAIVVAAITIVGIPVAVLLAFALPVATYVGLAAAATILGAALPFPQLQGNEVAQLAAGVAVLFLASLVPMVGEVGTAIAACLGFGALVRTRFRAELPDDLPPVRRVSNGPATAV